MQPLFDIERRKVVAAIRANRWRLWTIGTLFAAHPGTIYSIKNAMKDRNSVYSALNDEYDKNPKFSECLTQEDIAFLDRRDHETCQNYAKRRDEKPSL